MIGDGRNGHDDDSGGGDVVGDGPDVSTGGNATCSTPFSLICAF